jgi:hypothetical protein
MKVFLIKCAVALLCAATAFCGCKKTDAGAYQSTGVITEDYSYCAFCGGYFIRFDTDTTAKYRIKNDITKFGIYPGSKFPVHVYVNWRADTSASPAIMCSSSR